ncbi:MAG TPA: helix-turn-helix domain-containing protein [Pseudonocardiaceae bacterium]|jgi:hypothetical protein|nr:helix-turn-helix domain-containing protein [Pseudonocardiaceae bacterium]
MELTIDQQAELQALMRSADVPATVATRARIVLWWAEDRLKKHAAELAGVSRPTVDLQLGRYEAEGISHHYVATLWRENGDHAALGRPIGQQRR